MHDLQPEPRRGWSVRRIAACLAGAVLALALGEAVVRQVYWRPAVWDPDLGMIPAPGTAHRYAVEGHGTSVWAAGGIRRAEPPDPGRPAILVLGDSFTEALMIDDADVFPQRTERALRERGLDLQLLNAGASGYSAADYVARAPSLRARFDVRWTVVEILPSDLASDAWNPEKAHFQRADDGTLGVVTGRPVQRLRWLAPLARHSSLVTYGRVRLREFAAAARAEPPPFRVPERRSLAAAPADHPIEAAFDRLLAAYDGRVTIVLLADFRPPTSEEERVLAHCRAVRASCVSLRDALPAFAARHASPYGFPNSAWNEGHLNAEGHHAVADLLTAELLRLHALDLF